MRLMGKRQIGEMQPFEFVITLIIADLACVPMADVSIPLIYGVAGILSLFLLHQILTVVEQSGAVAKRLISGKPSIVIDGRGVNLTELKKNNMGIDDLVESMRAMGYFHLDDLEYAIFESNGKLSALEKEGYESKKAGVPLLVINSGKIVKENATRIGSSEQDVGDFVSRAGEKTRNVEVMTVDQSGRVYFKAKSKKYEILSYPISGSYKESQ